LGGYRQMFGGVFTLKNRTNYKLLGGCLLSTGGSLPIGGGGAKYHCSLLPTTLVHNEE